MTERLPDEPVSPVPGEPESAAGVPGATEPAPVADDREPAPVVAADDAEPVVTAADDAESVTVGAGGREPVLPAASADPEREPDPEPEPSSRAAWRGAADHGAWGAVTDVIGQPAAHAPRAGGAAQAGGTGHPPAAGRDMPGQRPVRAPDQMTGRPAESQPDHGVTRPDHGVTRPDPARRPDARRPDPRHPARPGGDILSDLQRWLLRSGAKSMRREIEGQVRRTFSGSARTDREDVWDTATTEPPPGVGEAPECAWCPICRAARRMRESGPGLGSQLSGAPGVVASAVQDAIVAFDAALSRTAPAPGQERPADRSPASGPADSASERAEGSQHEPGDRG